MERPSECVAINTALLKSTLEVEHSRTYWQQTGIAAGQIDAKRVFEECWFGSRSLPRVKYILTNLRMRFDAYPSCLPVLAGWKQMTAETRRSICHWHLQLADPLYRRFTGTFLVERVDTQRVGVQRDLVTRWVEQQTAGRWGLAGCAKFASQMLSAAYSAGLLTSNRDPRQMRFPTIDDDSLTYLLFLLWETGFEGTLLDNPYLASVGLRDDILERRLRRLSALRFRRQGDLIDFDWQFSSLQDWARATVCATEAMPLRGAS
jgi:hypothetical protein